jgi:murein DD-endopeptidase MepM/ murein hydrolase activator NlpD
MAPNCALMATMPLAHAQTIDSTRHRLPPLTGRPRHDRSSARVLGQQGRGRRVCAASQAQYAEYLEARARFEEAALAYEEVLNDIDITTRKRDRVANTLSQREANMVEVQDRIEEQAVQLYMQGGNTDSFVFFADSVDELITGTEFLAATSESDLGSLDDLLALKADMEGFQSELVDLDAELRVVEAERADIVDTQQQAADRGAGGVRSSLGRVSGSPGPVRSRAGSRPRQSRLLLRSSSRRRWWWRWRRWRWRWRRWRWCRGHLRVPVPLPGIIVHRLVGIPRSGGRRHKGVDMMGGYGNPIIAVTNGTVSVGNGNLGGRTIWLVGAGTATTTPTSAIGPSRTGSRCRPVR